MPVPGSRVLFLFSKRFLLSMMRLLIYAPCPKPTYFLFWAKGGLTGNAKNCLLSPVCEVQGDSFCKRMEGLPFRWGSAQNTLGRRDYQGALLCAGGHFWGAYPQPCEDVTFLFAPEAAALAAITTSRRHG